MQALREEHVKGVRELETQIDGLREQLGSADKEILTLKGDLAEASQEHEQVCVCVCVCVCICACVCVCVYVCVFHCVVRMMSRVGVTRKAKHT